MDAATPYNPLSKRNLAASIVAKLLNQQPESLPPQRVRGAGIYVIYYTGPFPAYRPIASANGHDRFAWPIYVGKAIPKGGRKGLEGFDVPHGFVLSARLRQHADSIRAAADTLSLADLGAAASSWTRFSFLLPKACSSFTSSLFGTWCSTALATTRQGGDEPVARNLAGT